MIAGVLTLSGTDMMEIKARGWYDYCIHRIVYDMFEDVRTDDDKKKSVSSGILYADIGSTPLSRQILFLSNREPKVPAFGQIVVKQIPAGLLSHNLYRFDVIVNPVRRDLASQKLVPVKGEGAIANWFVLRSRSSWGFEVDRTKIAIERVRVLQYVKMGRKVTIQQARVKGILRVIDRDQFRKSFERGIGKGHAFGCGLLQIVPIIHQ